MKDILTQGVLCFVHNFVNNKLPIIFDNYFKKFTDVHNLNTRNKDKFVIPKHRTVLGSKTIKYMGSIKWNIIGQKIKEIRNIKGFRKVWKKSLLLVTQCTCLSLGISGSSTSSPVPVSSNCCSLTVSITGS